MTSSTGAVPASVVLRFKIGDRQVRITALSTDTPTQLAAKLAAAITADAGMVVTAASALGVMTCTAKNAGEVGHDINLRVDVVAQPIPPGLTIVIAPMSGGSGNPVVQAVLDLLANTWYTDIQMPWSDATNMVALSLWLAGRYLATAKLDCHAYVAKAGTYGQLGTFGALTNSPFLTPMGLNKSPSNSWVLSAAVMGLACFHMTNDPSRQMRSLVVPMVTAPDPADQFTEQEQDLLLRAGVSTFDHLSDGATTISRLITSYKTSSLGVADRAWLDIMVPQTLSRIRYDWASYAALMYPRSKLVDDESEASFVSRGESDEDIGNAVVTARRMHASWAARCRLGGAYVEKLALDAQSGKWSYAAAGGTANALTATLNPAPGAISAGMNICLLVASANAAGAVTLNVNALGNVAIKGEDGTDLPAAAITPGLIKLTYDGAKWLLSGFGSAASRKMISRELQRFAIVADQKETGTHGGSFTSGAWRTRDLNTVLIDPSGLVASGGLAIASNQITLSAGAWLLVASVPAANVNGHKSRIQNITDGVTAAWGSSENASDPAGTDTVMTRSAITTLLTLASPKTFEFQHYCASTQATSGFGFSFGTAGGLETFTMATVTKIG